MLMLFDQSNQHPYKVHYLIKLFIKVHGLMKIFMKVNDFGPSWRDGNAFIAVVNSIRPGNNKEISKEN